MTDLHTHILPGMDDGARDADMSLEMLRMEWEQGVDTVVLSPHFYAYRESPESFLSRREKAEGVLRERIAGLDKARQDCLPRLITAAEVAWTPNLVDMPFLRNMCIGSSDNFLLELPYGIWDKAMAGQILELVNRTGLNPVLVHLERYMSRQPAGRIEEILSLGLSVQLSADTLLSGMLQKKGALKALKTWAHFAASDCHDTHSRRPCLGEAMAVVEKKLGREAAIAMDRRAGLLLI